MILRRYETSRPRAGTASKYAGAESTVDDWLAFTKQTHGTPDALTRASAKQLLVDSGAEIGSWCFRPSSKGTSTMVLCILITAQNNVANLRIETKRSGKVDVYVNHTVEPRSSPFFSTALKIVSWDVFRTQQSGHRCCNNNKITPISFT